MRRILGNVVTVFGLAGALWGGLAEPARAGIGACGNIHLEAEAMCMVAIDCEAMCEPLSVRAACAASLAADCRGGCPELPSVECTGSCSGSCEAECSNLEPGMFDCRGSCEADCSGRCEASCEANEDRAGCEASCQGSCSASCEGSCDVELPEADCMAGCEASCEGSCEADANFECQIDCQAMGQADCEAEVSGGCEVACQSEEGAVFCDGQYVDHGNNLEECLSALREGFEVEVQAEASGEAKASLSSDCSVAQPGTRGTRAAGLGLLVLGALILARRRSSTRI
jgi:MYXO-CTERM domain-containing protein